MTCRSLRLFLFFLSYTFLIFHCDYDTMCTPNGESMRMAMKPGRIVGSVICYYLLFVLRRKKVKEEKRWLVVRQSKIKQLIVFYDKFLCVFFIGAWDNGGGARG